MRDATFTYLNLLVAEHKKINYSTDPYRVAALKGFESSRDPATAPLQVHPRSSC